VEKNENRMMFCRGIVVENNATPLPLSDPDSNGIKSQFVTCSVRELRPHPSYARHSLSVQAFKLAALADLGDLAFQYPLIITRDRLIIDGYGRWELAKQKGLLTLPCVECDLSEEQALEWLCQTHGPSKGWSDFIRIELALDLEPHFQGKAVLNQQSGGRGKALSKLTEAQRVNSRREVARVAHVSLGNVPKVKHILANACSSLQEAVRTQEISINRADKWSHKPEAEQQEHLRLRRIEKGIRKKARQLVAAHLAELSLSKADERVLRVSDLVRLVNQLTNTSPDQSNELGSIEVSLVSGPGRAIFVTEELIQALRPRHEAVKGVFLTKEALPSFLPP
jgi:hypothetical protein